MSNKKISELPLAGPLDGTELVPIVQGGQTVRAPSGAIVELTEETDLSEVLLRLYDTDAIEPVLITTVDETHEDDHWSGGGLGIHIIEVMFEEDTWRDLLVRVKEDPETIGVWRGVDPRAGATTPDDFIEPEYVTGYEGDNFWPIKFEANVTYYVGIYKDTWEGAGGIVDIGPTEYALSQPSRVKPVRDLLFPAAYVEGQQSHAQNFRTHAEGFASHAEGFGSHAEGPQSHAGGYFTHAEGWGSYAHGHSSHAEGQYSHAEGGISHAEGRWSHAEGFYSRARWDSSHAGSGGRFSVSGDAQYERIVRQANNVSALDCEVLPQNFMGMFRAMVARRSSDGQVMKTWKLEGCISTFGTPSLLPGSSKEVLCELPGAEGWDLTLAVDTTTRRFTIAPVGASSGSRTVATVEYVEVG